MEELYFTLLVLNNLRTQRMLKGKKKQSVAVIVLNWNGFEDTRECIESVSKNDYKDFKVIVVDNGSINGEVVRLKNKFGSRIMILESKKNLGYCGGSNLGANYCKNLKFDYFMILNNDTIAEPKLISTLVKAIEKDHKIAAVNPVVFQYFKKNIIENTGLRFNMWHGEITPNNIGQKQPVCLRQPDIICGTCFLFRTSILHDIKYLFDEDFFCYYEDPDLSVRLKNKGYKIAVCYNAVIWHKGHASSRKVSGFTEFQAIRNRFLMESKNATLTQKITFLIIMLFLYFPFRFLKIAVFKKDGNLNYFLRGFRAGLRVFFGGKLEKFNKVF